MPSMQSPVLIGRRAELDALVSALDRARAGDGSALFLTGDPGVGKSRLATEISSLASARGFAVYASRAVQAASAAPPHGTLADALRTASLNTILDRVTADSPRHSV